MTSAQSKVSTVKMVCSWANLHSKKTTKLTHKRCSLFPHMTTASPKSFIYKVFQPFEEIKMSLSQYVLTLWALTTHTHTKYAFDIFCLYPWLPDPHIHTHHIALP